MNLTISTNNINEAYQHLRSVGVIHTQKEMADLMGSTASNISKALKGDPRFLTESFLRRFNKTFGGIFEESWLMGDNVHINMLRSSIDTKIIPVFYSESRQQFQTDGKEDLMHLRSYELLCKTTYPLWDGFRPKISELREKINEDISFGLMNELWHDYDKCCDRGENNNWTPPKEILFNYGIDIVQEETDTKENNEETTKDFSLVPLINIDSVGGMDSSNALASGDQFVERLIPFTGAQEGDRAIYQSGDSMTPTIPAGSILQIRKVDDWREYFGYGGIFVLWLKDNRRITKQVMKYTPDPQNYVTCHSFNPDAADEELPKNFIREVWKVIKVLTDRGW